jgi:hypothetical protein
MCRLCVMNSRYVTTAPRAATDCGQVMDIPPSTTSVWPVT